MIDGPHITQLHGKVALRDRVVELMETQVGQRPNAFGVGTPTIRAPVGMFDVVQSLLHESFSPQFEPNPRPEDPTGDIGCITIKRVVDVFERLGLAEKEF